MNATLRKPTKENFEVDSALLSEIGEKLVTTPHVALSELVKNAYDADATEVHVTIGADKRGLPTVVVRDNGNGMTRDAVHDYWMRIGTTNKEDNQFSPRFGRRRTGAKGIGRFACRRLGRVLELETLALLPKAVDGHKCQYTELTFRWDDFKPGSTVSKIVVHGSTELRREGESSLTLSITGAQTDEWSYRGYAYLKRQLAALCANRGARREGYEDDPGFQVYLTAPGLQAEGETADLREQLMNAGWATLTARIDKDHHAVCTLFSKGLGKRTIRSSHPFPHLKDVHIHLGIFPFEKEWLRDKSVVTKTSIADLCEEWGGVQMKFRGFRIYPYGDQLDDWLDIESDRARRLGKPTEDDIFNYAHSLDTVVPSRSLLNMLSMKSYLGSVEIGLKQGGLEPKADRMGFVDGEVFREVKRFTRFAIDWAMVIRDFEVQLDEVERRKELRRKLVDVHKQNLPATESAEDAVKIMRGAIKELALHAPARSQPAMELLQDAAAFLESTVKITTRDLLRLRLVASGATLTLLFAHEVRSLTSTFISISKSLKKMARGLPSKKRAELEELGEEVSESQKSLGELLELTNAMGVDQKAPPVPIELREAAQRSVARFARVRTRYNIDVDVDGIPEGLQVGPMREGELFAVLINAISNSIKAVIAGGGQRLISLKAEKVGKHVQMDVLDTGIGLPEHHFANVFTPLVSDPSGTLYDRLEKKLNPEDSLLLGRGSGLGLAILRGILQARNGDARMLPPSQGWKCHLRLELP